MTERRLTAWRRPVLESVVTTVPATRHVATRVDAVERVADWLAYEPLALPSGGPAGPFDFGDDTDTIIDAVMVKECLDFAFTDFATGHRFEVEYMGATWSDSEALLACLHRAWREGEAILEGERLASVSTEDLSRWFRGSIEMPMVDERAEVLREAGERLVTSYEGRFHRFVRSCAPAVYAGGDGLLERLIVEFPRFDDRSEYHGHDVVFHKLGQLALWSLHLKVGEEGGLALSDLDALSAFADYVVPVALRLMGVLEYTEELEERIARGDLIERDSDEEVEIRAHSLYATALLTEAINQRRQPDEHIVIPQLDYRLWSAYHTTRWPHHLTKTVMY